jgi:hypothetical protein
VSTASHGGLYVTGEALERIPRQFRMATFSKDEHWYEEDVDFAIVARFVPGAYPPMPGFVDLCDAMLRRYHKWAYAAWESDEAARRALEPR